MKKLTKNILIVLGIVIFLWCWVTTITQAIKNPSMTQTELFLNIPNSFLLDFKVN